MEKGAAYTRVNTVSKKYKEPFLAENKVYFPCNNHYLAILSLNSNQDNASNHNDPSTI